MLVAVPNVSEGRNPRTLELIAGAHGHARLLHCSSDGDHNRTVLWLAAEPGDLVDACVGIAERAAQSIDLRAHTGEHPRVGALDVLPFVAHDLPQAVAVDAALDAARRISADLAIPVYLYGTASPSGRALPLVRTSFERLGAGTADPPVPPDLGPARLHPSAGAVCVGVRGPLVAFNVVLRGPLEGARRVAAAVRGPDLRTLAFDLRSRGLVQVSMNLVRPARTGPRAGFEAVRDRAAGEGLEVVEAEVVGLVPHACLQELEGLPLSTPARSVEDELRR